MAGREQIDAVQKRKLELSEQLEASRIAMSYGKHALKESCNVKRRVVRSVQRNQSKWVMASALVAGLVGSTWLRRRAKKSSDSGAKKTFGGMVKGFIISAIIKRMKAKAMDKAKALLIQKIQNRHLSH